MGLSTDGLTIRVYLKDRSLQMLGGAMIDWLIDYYTHVGLQYIIHCYSMLFWHL
jgi:hypothetical protein